MVCNNDWCLLGKGEVLVLFKALPYVRGDFVIPRNALVIISEVLPVLKPFTHTV
jgi:hypothetical protein